MDTVLRYRGREVSSADVAFIASLIAEHPQAKRKKLSVMLCQAWNWVQPNGALRDGVCRSLLLTLHRAGHIMLPPSQCPKRRAPARRRRVAPAEIEVPSDPVCAPLGAIGPVEIRQVRRTPEEGLVEGLLARHHYLGYQQPVGEHLKYLVVAGADPSRASAGRRRRSTWMPATGTSVGHTRHAGRTCDWSPIRAGS